MHAPGSAGGNTLSDGSGSVHSMLCTTMLLCVSGASPVAPVLLDGRFTDWPERTSLPDNSLPTVMGAGDASHIYLQIVLEGSPVNLQGLDDPAVLLLDLDGSAHTGGRNLALAGTDLEVIFSPKLGRRSGGVQLRCPERLDGNQYPDLVDLVFAPTTASTRFELRLPRTLAFRSGSLTVGDHVHWALEGSLGSARGTCRTSPERPTPTDSFETIPSRAAGATRVVSWNVEFGGLLDHPEPFIRILKALSPDVLLLQELEPDQQAEDIAAVLQQGVKGNWVVNLGPVNGQLRSAVATRLPSTNVPAIDALKRRDAPDRGVRAAALQVQLPSGSTVLMASLHLKCCGVADGPEDMTRIAETLAVRRAVMEAHSTNPSDGLLLGGDLNLVGSTVPLDLLVLDGEELLGGDGDLVVVDALRPDGCGLQTWNKDGQQYTPGRLDWIVLSGSSLTVQQSFVLATSELSESALQAAGLHPSDAADAADHLPVVVDLVPVKP